MGLKCQYQSHRYFPGPHQDSLRLEGIVILEAFGREKRHQEIMEADSLTDLPVVC